MHAVPHLGGWLTHHSLRQSAKLHVVGGEDRLPVALDECRLLGDEPERVLQMRTQVTQGRPRGAAVKRGRAGATLTASMTTGTPLALDASRMPCKKGRQLSTEPVA